MYKPEQIKNFFLLSIKNKFRTFHISSSSKILNKKIISTLSLILFILILFLPVKAEEQILESEIINSGYLIFGGKLIEPPYKIELKIKIISPDEDKKYTTYVNGIIVNEIIETGINNKIEEENKILKRNIRAKYHNLREKYTEEEAKNLLEDEIVKEIDKTEYLSKKKKMDRISLRNKKSEIEFLDGNIIDFELERPLSDSEIASDLQTTMLNNYDKWKKEFGKGKAIELLREFLNKIKGKDVLLDYEIDNNGEIRVKYRQFGEWMGIMHVSVANKPPKLIDTIRGEFRYLVGGLKKGNLEIMPKKGVGTISIPFVYNPKDIINGINEIILQNIAKEEKIRKIKNILDIEERFIDQIIDHWDK